ncbi:type VII toxin-antitoxin system HepT family RNase toxin [Desulfolucanica intricata]|uniref:type VII toxin-antitoxin system HepT family RNase toxin n=1 Tax=Desulfolucanica intricata TaxID=1285191 RepID=UPI0008340DE4|nr:HepT-like ribonuclease domain-containing protein [Desulfolucanica intricata]
MNLNIDMLQQKSADIAHSRKMLDKYGSMPRDKFLADETVVSAAKYQLLIGIEAAQNICNHLAARVAKRAPVSYGDCYKILNEEGLIDKGLAGRMAKMAKFQNLLVYNYGNIDIITGGDLDEFFD